MDRKNVIISVGVLCISLLSFPTFACSLSAGQCAAAEAVASAIKSKLPKGSDSHDGSCGNHSPFLITGGDDKSITNALNTAVRERYPSIRLKLAPAAALGAFPVSVADALNRVQLSGGTVQQKEDTGQQSGGLLAAWAGEQLGELVTQAVSALLDAVLNQWVTDSYKGYNAVLLYRKSQTQGPVYHEVNFSCKN